MTSKMDPQSMQNETGGAQGAPGSARGGLRLALVRLESLPGCEKEGPKNNPENGQPKNRSFGVWLGPDAISFDLHGKMGAARRNADATGEDKEG